MRQEFGGGPQCLHQTQPPPANPHAHSSTRMVPVGAGRWGGASYSGHPHDHLPVGGRAQAVIGGPQLAQDVQDGVATVVVEYSPYALARAPSSVAQAGAVGATAPPRPRPPAPFPS